MRFLKTSGLVSVMSLLSLAGLAQDRTNMQAAQGTLPVMFDSVRVVIRDDEVQIGWSNLTEREVSVYLVERSENGIDFKPLYQQQPSSNLNEKAAYSFTDQDPLEGNSYYRIRVMILSGRAIFSRVLKAQTKFSAPGFSVYPNPVTDEKFNVNLSGVKKGHYRLELFNSAGIALQSASLNLQADGITESFGFPSGVKPGLYILSVKGEEYRGSVLLVKK